jgi:hypothetical protein
LTAVFKVVEGTLWIARISTEIVMAFFRPKETLKMFEIAFQIDSEKYPTSVKSKEIGRTSEFGRGS